MQDGRHCTTSYLETLWFNYCLVQWFCQTEGDEGPEDIDPLFSPVCSELERLQKHPELFPSEEAEQVFWRRLKNALEKIIQIRSILCEDEKKDSEFLSDDAKEMLADILPSRSESRKPWEQFLHNRAPGAGVDLSDMGSNGSIQILPMGALRLLHGMKEANTSIIRGIEAVCSAMSAGEMILPADKGTMFEQARRSRGVEMPYQVGSVSSIKRSTFECLN